MDKISVYFSQFLAALNSNQGALIALFTAVLVYLNYRLAKETKRIREVSSEPNIEVYLVPHEQSSAFVNMVVKNSGGGPARDVKWTIEYDKENVRQKKIQIFKMSLFHVLHYIPSGEQFKFFFGSSVELLSEPKMKPITIKTSYSNDFNKNVQNKSFKIDIEPWKGMTTVGRPPIYEIAEDITDIKKILQSSLAGNVPPLFRVQPEDKYQEELETERKEWEQSIAQENDENIS